MQIFAQNSAKNSSLIQFRKKNFAIFLTRKNSSDKMFEVELIKFKKTLNKFISL